MSEFPYTDEQVAAVAACYRKAFDVNLPDLHAPKDDCYRDEARDLLTSLHGAGITVQFPEPLFYAQPYELGWEVRVRKDLGGWVARFDQCGNAEQYAREHADRLNRETS